MKSAYRNINIELTNACTFSCTFCPNGIMARKKEMLDFNLVKKLIDEISEMRLAPLINYYVMGEPLLYPKLFEVIEYTKSKGIKVKINTNGTLLDETGCGRLLDAGPDEIYVSFLTPAAELFNTRNCEIKNLLFETWYNQILSLLKKKIQNKHNNSEIHVLFLKYSGLLKMNTLKIPHLKEKICANLKSLFKEIGTAENNKFMKFIFSNGLIQRYSTSFKIADGIYFDVIKFHNWANINENRIYKAWFGSCEAFRKTCAILSNGGVSLCCADYNGDLIIGNVYKESLNDILYSKRVRNIINSFKANKLPFEKCKICRGGPTIPLWLKNQIASVIHYNWNKE